MRKHLDFIFVMVLFLPFIGQSQTNIEGRSIPQGRIVISNAKVIDCFNISISKDSVEYYGKDLITRNAFALRQVDKIQEVRGTWGNTGMWVGSGIGLGLGVVASLATVETKTTGYYQETKVQVWPVYLCTALGALMGYLIGNSANDWGTVYPRDVGALINRDIRTNSNLGGLYVMYRVNF